MKTTHPFPLARKPKASGHDDKYTGTVTLRDWRPPVARSQVRGRLSTDGPGTASVPGVQHRPAPALEALPSGIDS